VGLQDFLAGLIRTFLDAANDVGGDRSARGHVFGDEPGVGFGGNVVIVFASAHAVDCDILSEDVNSAQEDMGQDEPDARAENGQVGPAQWF
jgi:hypothetical protein